MWSWWSTDESNTIVYCGSRGRDRMVAEFITTYAINAYHHWCCEFESRSGRGVQYYLIKFVSDLGKVGGFLRFPPLKNWPPRYSWNIVALNATTHHLYLLPFIMRVYVGFLYRLMFIFMSSLQMWLKSYFTFCFCAIEYKFPPNSNAVSVKWTCNCYIIHFYWGDHEDQQTRTKQSSLHSLVYQEVNITMCTFFYKFGNMHIALNELGLREFPLPGQISSPQVFIRVRVSQSSVSV